MPHPVSISTADESLRLSFRHPATDKNPQNFENDNWKTPIWKMDN